MPNRNQVAEEILGAKKNSQDEVRRKYLEDLNKYTKRDTILYASAFIMKKHPQLPASFVSVTGDDLQGFMSALQGLKGDSLDLILHSPGGSLEAADQIVQYLRSKYRHIRAIIPQNAMSAATMIACACDSIVMGKHSAIGPIDPQISFPTFTAPAQAILDEFEQAKKEVIAEPKVAPLWFSKINSYPPGFLQNCQNVIALSQMKVAEWLDQYMFKDASEKKGLQIAAWLGNHREHKTHGRPIGIAKAMEIGLKIEALENDQHLQEKVLTVFHATMITLEISECTKLIENHLGKGWFLLVKLEAK